MDARKTLLSSISPTVQLHLFRNGDCVSGFGGGFPGKAAERYAVEFEETAHCADAPNWLH